MARQRRCFVRVFNLFLVILGLGLFGSGCGTVQYLLQATGGQMRIMNKGRPIKEVIRDERTPPRIAELLGQIESIKNYGEQNGLKKTSNYQEYVKMDGNAAVWVVTACKPLEFKPKIWSFPLVGSFNYLGWFDREDADEFAAELREEGWDVDVRGASAYSTLGWFRDPILSSMIYKGDHAFGSLVNVVLHESVHASLYINGQSYFNESVATFAGDTMTEQYLLKMRGKDHKDTQTYRKNRKRGKVRLKKLHAAYKELDTLYKSKKSAAVKKKEKSRILARTKKELNFPRDITNATLVNFRTYGVGKHEFKALYESCSKDWNKFWAALAELNEEDFEKPQQQDLAPMLLSMAKAGCKKPSRLAAKN